MVPPAATVHEYELIPLSVVYTSFEELAQTEPLPEMAGTGSAKILTLKTEGEVAVQLLPLI